MAKKAPTGKPPKRPRIGASPVGKPHSPAAPLADLPIPVVGIGASAGGLEAFRELLEALPNDTGMAFVLVSHLSRTHESMLAELLSKATRMPVAEVRAQTPIQANHVYVIPPSAALAIENGGLSARPLVTGSHPVMVIDAFFRSLAEHRKSQAIGVVLSGTGTDGTLGLAAIKAEGGIAFVQDQTAKYPGMPRSAGARFGSADFVLPPAQISEELARIAVHPYVRQPKTEGEQEPEPPTPEAQFTRVFRLVLASSGVDFAHYKPATIRRRIARRMVLNKIETLSAYVKRLESDTSEVEALYQDLLINVTCFFRDQETWEFLRDRIVPEILRHRPSGQPVRVWVPGCATGEEAYSIAMMLIEAWPPSEGPVVQIFASDISKQAVQAARDGLYTENIVADVSPERLRRFFVKFNDGYQVSKQVRDLCIFAVHDVTQDPPFSKMDLISCRNLLIYLGASLQKRVLTTFHYALNPGGNLLLGNSETVGAGSEMFGQIDKKHKLYSRLLTLVRPHFEFVPAELADGPAAARKQGFLSRPATDVGKEADRIVLSQYSPPGVLVNAQFDVIQFRGRTGPFLEPSPGQATLNLFKMARAGLAIDLRTALHQAQKSREPVHKSGVRVRGESGVKDVDLDVTPIFDNGVHESYYLVLFQTVERPTIHEKPLPAPKTAKGTRSDAEREIATLRSELAATQQDLHSIIEEQEATNEELQSANEEILSSNEELQSTNEELETAREELQGTNEELTTVNDELQNRNAELAKLNGDLTNLIDSMDVIYVMLDRDLKIRRFTPAAQRVLNLIPTDVGRPIGHIKPNLQVADLPGLIQDVIKNMQQREQDVRDSSGRLYCMRMRPYKTQDGKIEGAILTLTDIGALRHSEESSYSLEKGLRSLVRQAPDLLLAVSPEGHVLLVNTSAAARTVPGNPSIFELLAPQDREAMRQCLRRALDTGAAADIEVHSFALQERNGPTILTLEPIQSGEGVIAFSVRTKHAS
jgi:two-component system, chemotaxis family, CheB/CheR fusion protein